MGESVRLCLEELVDEGTAGAKGWGVERGTGIGIGALVREGTGACAWDW